jgi:hypothetical protein
LVDIAGIPYVFFWKNLPFRVVWSAFFDAEKSRKPLFDTAGAYSSEGAS